MGTDGECRDEWGGCDVMNKIVWLMTKAPCFGYMKEEKWIGRQGYKQMRQVKGRKQ